MSVQRKPAQGLYLVGFMASGKTTIGRALAREIGCPFFDIDTEIEARERRAIAQIFLEHGERRFREVESEVLRHCVAQIETSGPAVVALGGGAFVEPANRALIENSGVSVWLDCPLEIVHKRLGDDGTRPLAANRNGIEKLFAERRSSYALANHRIEVDTDDSSITVRRLLALPILPHAPKEPRA
jgi:shikimate kinase